MERWNGRVALVTGASVGIGESICKELVKHGMIVVGCATDVGKIQALVKDKDVSKGSGKLHAIKCDLQQESEILAMFDEIRKTFGRVDVCINNAGITIDSAMFDFNRRTEDWKQMLEVNVLGLCICTRESLALMKENNIEDGQIIQMGCLVGHRMPNLPVGHPILGVYYGSKFMVRALTESLRQELKASNSRIRVATISPGTVETEMMSRSLGSVTSTILFRYTVCLKAKDIADAVTFVLSRPSHMNVDDIIVQPINYSI